MKIWEKSLDNQASAYILEFQPGFSNRRHSIDFPQLFFFYICATCVGGV